MARKFCVLLISFIVCFVLLSDSVLAQEFPSERFQALRAQFPANENSWTRQDYLKYGQDLASLMVDLVWLYQHPGKPKPAVEARLNAQRNPPVWDGEKIIYPIAYGHDMTQLGFILGRDIYIDSWRRLPEADPVLQHPFFAAHLARAIDPSIFALSPFFDAKSDLIMCKLDQQKGCLAGQALDGMALQLFLVAHECGHYVLNHQLIRNDDQELAADRYGWETLMAVAKAFHSNDEQSNDFYDLIFAGAAEAPLWYERQSRAWSASLNSSQTNQSDSLLEKRIDQIEKLTDKVNIDVSRFMPTSYAGWQLQKATLKFQRDPKFLIVGGVRIRTSDIKDNTLRFPDALTYLLAADDTGLICQEVFGTEDALDLQFAPWTEASAQKLEQLKTGHKWCEIIAATADARLFPRSGELAPYLNEALYYTGASLLIQPSMISGGNRQRFERRQRSELHLTSWGIH